MMKRVFVTCPGGWCFTGDNDSINEPAASYIALCGSANTRFNAFVTTAFLFVIKI